MAEEKENTGGKEQQDDKAAEDSTGRSSTELDSEGLGTEEILEADAAEEKTDDTQKETSQKKKGRKREYVLMSVSLLLVVIVISGGAFIWARYFASNEGLALNSSRGYEYELKPFFVPLAKAESRKFLRVNMIIELPDKRSSKQIAKRIKEVRGSILSILINAPPKNIESSQGKEVLAEEITSTINLLLGEEVVKGVFFNEALVV
jgi:flagellar basal body-associated protein FliL